MSERTPFALTVSLRDLPQSGRRFVIEADAEAREEIARRLKIPGVDHLAGQFEVIPSKDGAKVKGALEAHLVRQCVASLEAMEERLAEAFEIRFSRDALEQSDDVDAEIEIDEDTPEPLDADSIDLAEILIQQLALAMAPYPRKEGTTALAEAYGDDKPISPFEALRETFTAPRDKE